jgi:tRNA(adenine34) deaminase
MDRALALAREAGQEGEVPVGAVVVCDGQLVGEGWNRNIALDDPTAHAEILAMRGAGKTLANYRLPGCVLYVTLEPCLMCAGAMIHARIDRLVFGAVDPKTGAAGGRFDLLLQSGHNHRVRVEGGCRAEEGGELLRRFFRDRRGSA